MRLVGKGMGMEAAAAEARREMDRALHDGTRLPL